MSVTLTGSEAILCICGMGAASTIAFSLARSHWEDGERGAAAVDFFVMVIWGLTALKIAERML